MAELNTTFYQEEDGYSDGALETELKERIENGESISEILKQDSRWPVFYHLSPKRENILSWYPFRPDCSILEIGSGLGALTGLLSQVANDVKSVELTMDRALVNYARHKNLDNVEILVGNFDYMDFDQKFDYIILNGVLEYAMSFTESKSPYEDFLKNILKYLKPDGTVLIAIENRLGLKYFNGVPEDHTAQLFSGLDGYPYTNNVRTFSKQELTDLLNRVGLENLRFYYPNPDYKFPQTIYTDESMKMFDTNVETDVFNINRVRFFDESKVLRSLLDEGIADRFCNSFLVEARQNPQEEDTRVIFSKISDRRKPEFQLKTTITEDKNGVRRVYKDPLTKQSQAHIDRMVQYFNEVPRVGQFVNTSLEKNGDGVVFDYIEGETFDKKLLAYLREDKTEEFDQAIRHFAEALYEGSELQDDYCTDEFKTVFGPETLSVPLHVKKGSNLDMIFTNIIESDEDYVIDYEWIIDFALPQEFVMWRSLYYLYNNNDLVEMGYGMPELMNLAGIDLDLHSTFLAWDDYFGNTYIQNTEDEIYKNRTIDAVPFLNEMIGIHDIISSIYLDFGEGDSEEYRITDNVVFDADNFEVHFDLKPYLEKANSRLKSIRWDPLERACSITDLELETDGGDVEIYDFSDVSDQVIKLNGVLNFLDDDPQVKILGNYDNLGEITIRGKLVYINTKEALDIAKEVRWLTHQLQLAIDEQHDTIADLNTHIHNLEAIIAGAGIEI